MSNKELMEVKGGSVSGAVVEAFVKVLDSIFNFGRSLGTSIRRIIKKSYCQ